jgi:MFS family permease
MATMGLATTLVGILPTYATAGILAPLLLLILRLLQGLALGGEYGGAATYVAEHVPDNRRGYYTSYIQTTATLGFFLSMGVIGTTRLYFGEEAFKAHGWRVPFLLSFVLLLVSVYIRVKMSESPVFAKLKSSGKISRNPIKEALGNPVNRRYVIIALLGATAGQGVVWYTGQFYALSFLQSTLKVDWQTSYIVVSIALAVATPLFLLFGWLSDRIGRKKIMMAGCALAALTYVPIYMAMRHFANPDGLPKADPAQVNHVALVLLLTLQMVYVCMVYGPIAAFLVELFPTKIRYTSMSLPYHLGNGWFGGFLPLIATWVTVSAWATDLLGPNAMFAGLAYPILVCLITIAVSARYIRETKDHRIDAEV